jgi:hypothetical protein
MMADIVFTKMYVSTLTMAGRVITAVTGMMKP